MVSMENADKHIILEWLNEVKDPEVPVLSITDLGIVRELSWEREKLIVTVTPTYSGCPAMDVIASGIKMLLAEKGIAATEVRTILSPAWTTDWMTEKGKQALKAYGIAPPNPTQQVCTPDDFAPEEAVSCPHCGAGNTSQVSRFGSTACKALYKCNVCKEPFDYFKCH
jgi:ring-1,2-phenylacetyl-CoA epoxidase subunit PaaD